jgi:hypothetical protein
MTASGNPDDGHTFEISVRVRSSSSVVGDLHHTDAPDFDGPTMIQQVRAWSLRAALERAVELPLGAWFPEDQAEPRAPRRLISVHADTLCAECGAPTRPRTNGGAVASGIECTTCDWWFCW